MKKVFVVVCCALGLMMSGPIYAENVKMDEVVVTATRTEALMSQIPASGTVISRKEIEEGQAATLSEVLRDVPGLDVVQQGGAGKTTSVFIRGAESRHTLVLIDGIRVNSPTTGGFDFADLNIEDVERIEIVRGPLSTLYGSDAIGGVIQIITKKGTASSATVDFEGGSYGTAKEDISAEVKKEDYDLALTASRWDVEGFSQASTGSERDGHQNTTLSSRIGLLRKGATRIDITARLTESKTDLDGWGVDGRPMDDPNYQQQRRWSVLGISIASPLSSQWDHRLSISSSNEDLITFDEDTPSNRFRIRMGIKTIDWQHAIRKEEGHQLTLGYEWQDQSGEIESSFNKSFSTNALYLQEQRGIGQSAQYLIGLRWDNSTIYESALTYRVGVSYFPTPGVKWHTQYGTGFHGPTLNQLFWPDDGYFVGNPDLKPEKSRGWEVGVEQALSGALSLSVNYYANVFEDLIQPRPVDPSDPFGKGTLRNVAQADSNGIEADAVWNLSPGVQIRGNYTYNDTEDRETHSYLLRRPLNKYDLVLRLGSSVKGHIEMKFLHTGKRFDYGSDSDGKPNSLPAYSRVDLLAAHRISKTTEIFGRIENLFDKGYEEVKGYSTAGVSAYGGLRMAF
ncbi:MAG: TonB-dependent receptor [Nitrospirae bacterium]|nr:TonB-dependent receptor [Nitrospirota bacterium]MBI5097153.1 TonB-dependent receptor [Nitrospirota bacterium]